ncbi:MAG: hypothetical protein WCA46_12485, partial [Actinocatenispora sp.]
MTTLTVVLTMFGLGCAGVGFVLGHIATPERAGPLRATGRCTHVPAERLGRDAPTVRALPGAPVRSPAGDADPT